MDKIGSENCPGFKQLSSNLNFKSMAMKKPKQETFILPRVVVDQSQANLFLAHITNDGAALSTLRLGTKLPTASLQELDLARSCDINSPNSIVKRGRGRPRAPLAMDIINDLLRNGNSIGAVARHYGVNRKTVQRFLRREAAKRKKT